MSDKTIPTPTTSPEPPNREKLLDLSLPSILAGAAASMTVAVLSARLGVAGTVAGAALASIAFALVNAVYAASLKRTHHGLTLIVARRAPEVETADSPRRRALALAGVTVAAVTTFGVTLAGLAGFEASTGRTVADAPVTTIIRVVEVETTRAAAPAEPAPTVTVEANSSTVVAPQDAATDTPPQPSAPITSAPATTSPASTAPAAPTTSAPSAAETAAPAASAPGPVKQSAAEGVPAPVH